MSYRTLHNRLNKAWSVTYAHATRVLFARDYDALFARVDELFTREEADALFENWASTRDGKAPREVQAIAERLNADPIAGPLLRDARAYDALLQRAWWPGCVLPKEAKR
jgi:hypothetical protein